MTPADRLMDLSPGPKALLFSMLPSSTFPSCDHLGSMVASVFWNGFDIDEVAGSDSATVGTSGVSEFLLVLLMTSSAWNAMSPPSRLPGCSS